MRQENSKRDIPVPRKFIAIREEIDKSISGEIFIPALKLKELLLNLKNLASENLNQELIEFYHNVPDFPEFQKSPKLIRAEEVSQLKIKDLEKKISRKSRKKIETLEVELNFTLDQARKAIANNPNTDEFNLKIKDEELQFLDEIEIYNDFDSDDFDSDSISNFYIEFSQESLQKNINRKEIDEILGSYFSELEKFKMFRIELKEIEENLEDTYSVITKIKRSLKAQFKNEMQTYENQKCSYYNNYGWLKLFDSNRNEWENYRRQIKIYIDRLKLIESREKGKKTRFKSSNSAQFPPIKRVNWKLLEEYDSPVIDVIKEYIEGLPEYYDLDFSRFEKILELNPIEIYTGSNSFNGYICFCFQNIERVILESARYGNATYFISGDWENLSKLTKKQLLNRHYKVVSRCIHTDTGTWFRCIKKGMACKT